MTVKKRFADLMFRLGLNETIDQLAMENSVRWHGHVLLNLSPFSAISL